MVFFSSYDFFYVAEKQYKLIHWHHNEMENKMQEQQKQELGMEVIDCEMSQIKEITESLEVMMEQMYKHAQALRELQTMLEIGCEE